MCTKLGHHHHHTYLYIYIWSSTFCPYYVRILVLMNRIQLNLIYKDTIDSTHSALRVCKFLLPLTIKMTAYLIEQLIMLPISYTLVIQPGNHDTWRGDGCRIKSNTAIQTQRNKKYHNHYYGSVTLVTISVFGIFVLHICIIL